jgi:hypothetical protein
LLERDAHVTEYAPPAELLEAPNFMKAKPIPDGYHTATPYLIVNDATRALEFYKQVTRAAFSKGLRLKSNFLSIRLAAHLF